ncbi:MAG: hypothetical protein AAB648_00250 [Patescibacteria group bacterium]
MLTYYYNNNHNNSSLSSYLKGVEVNKENSEYLFKNFLFFHPEAPITKSLMAFGFECGDGWFELINELCKKLKALDLKDFRVLQVKEKFGGLRFYVNGVELDKADETYQLIDEAEAKSLTICEKCGKPGKSNEIGWIRTLCDNCRKAQ